MTGTERLSESDGEQDGKSMPAGLDLEAGRRAFLRCAGFGAAAAAILGAGIPLGGSAEAAPVTDVQILNFALNLEYLEAEFYLIAAFGRRLSNADTTGNGTRGPVTGGRKVTFPNGSLIGKYAEEIANDEEAHVKFLRAALGTKRVARPAINIGTAFAAAAQAAGLGSGFDAYANEQNFALAAYIFEDVGVTAYKGAAPLLQDKGTLEAAAGILAVEAYHAATIRSYLLGEHLAGQAAKISNLRDSADGPGDKDQGVILNGHLNVVPADANGIAFSRSPREVLNIVYLGRNAAKGGFFPNGVNGAIQ